MAQLLAEALLPLKRWFGDVVQEREILRAGATLATETSAAPAEIVDRARRIVLKWAERRIGARLPRDAWNGAPFDHLAGGRTTMAVRLAEDGGDLWALRTDDPDKTVARRTWTTEVVIGQAAGQPVRIGLRLTLSAPDMEAASDIEPATPGCLRQIAKTMVLLRDGHRLPAACWRIETAEDAATLGDILADPRRSFPVFVAAGDERAADPDAPLIDIDALAGAVTGIGMAVLLPARHTYALSDRFGRKRATYYGAVRSYLPGFDADADPYAHPLVLGESLQQSPEQRQRTLRTLRQQAARQSLLHLVLDRDILNFTTVRDTLLRLEQTRQSDDGAAEQLATTRGRQIEALQEDIRRRQGWEEQLYEMVEAAEARAVTAEAQARGAILRVQALRAGLTAGDQAEPASTQVPDRWSDVADWCDDALAGQVALTPNARRALKKSLFDDFALVVRCLLWLAGPCRDRRINGGGSLGEVPIEEGVHNSACGGDSYETDYQGHRLAIDWHVKNGGNTRNPRRCLRIYYGWDPMTQQIIVDELPGHRRTGAT